MLFDNIIMNPPYGKLYIPIIKESLKHVCENGQLISLNPINKFQHAVKLGKKLPISISSIEVFSQKYMSNIFNIHIWSEVGIVLINNDNKNDDHVNFEYIVDNLKLYRKISSSIYRIRNLFNKIPSNISLRFFDGCNRDEIHNFKITSLTYKNACKLHLNSHISFIDFNTEEERLNMYNTCAHKFIKFCCKLDCTLIPWMGNCVNPRTGKLGYKSEWTNEDFYMYFNIDKDE